MADVIERLGKSIPEEYLKSDIFSLQDITVQPLVFKALEFNLIGSDTFPLPCINSEEECSVAVMCVPFCMRTFEIDKDSKMHSSTRFVEACLRVCNEARDVSLFKSSALISILDYKWHHYGRFFFWFTFFLKITIIIHYGIYSVVWPTLIFVSIASFQHHDHPRGWYLQFVWSLVLAMHITLSFLIECCLVFLGEKHSIITHPLSISSILNHILNILSYLFIYTSIGMRFAEVDSDWTSVVSSIAFLLLWCTTIFSLRFTKIGHFVRMLTKVIPDLTGFILILVSYVLGFGYAMYLLFYNLDDAPYWSDDAVTRSHGGRFKLFAGSSMTMFFSMIGGADWTVEEFTLTPSYVTATVFYILFAIVSALYINFSISIMSHSFENVMSKVSITKKK